MEGVVSESYWITLPQILYLNNAYSYLGGGGILGETPKDSASGRGGSGKIDSSLAHIFLLHNCV